MKHRLADIDAANVCCHGTFLLVLPPILPHLLLEGDGPSHYLERPFSKDRLWKHIVWALQQRLEGSSSFVRVCCSMGVVWALSCFRWIHGVVFTGVLGAIASQDS